MGPLTATESAARDCMIDAADQARDMGGWMRRPPFAYNDAWPRPVDENLNFICYRPERWTKEPLDATFRPAAKGPL